MSSELPPLPVADSEKEATHPTTQGTPGFLARLWLGTKNLVRFYRTFRKQLWRLLAEAIPLLHAARDHDRELRLEAGQFYETAYRDSTGWKIQLPDCCVVCGRPTEQASTQETLGVEDLTWPMWSPITGLVIGGFFSFFLGSQWFLLVGLLGGFVVGYLNRRQIPVQLGLRRCPKHDGATDIPQIWAGPDSMTVLVGHKRVRRLFLWPEEGAKEKKQPAAPDAEEPGPLPLAEDGPVEDKPPPE